MQFLTPKAFEKLDIRIQWGLCFVWPMALAYMLGFIFIVAIPVGIMDGDLIATTLSYTKHFYLAVYPVFAIWIGSWLLFAYLISVTVPPALEMERGRPLIFYGYYAFKMFLVGLVISMLPARVPAFRRILWCICLTTNPLRRHTGVIPICRLDSGWSPGTHPPLVYE